MYHAHFRGTHYEAGFRWGSLLLKHKNIILENIPFEITQERIDYALSCLPIYEKYYHEIVEEIQGLADGQQCDVRILQAVLFSMYSMPPSCNCSCFAFTTEQEILLGRNSDFLTEIERLNQNVVYKLTDGVYSFTGNTTAFMGWERKKPPYNWHRTSGFPMRTGNRRERQKNQSPGRNPRRNSFRKQRAAASVFLPTISTCSGHGERNMPRTPRRNPFIPGLWKPYRSKTKWNICWMCCSLGKRRKKRL